ncbi:MAG: LD-carboxypeptidase [Marinifilaceae bacterium]
MYQPPALRKGDRIGIVAPAGRIAKEKVIPAVKRFEDWGLKVVMGNHVFSDYNQFAGKDKDRLQDLQDMLDDSNIRAIVCARGGYGCIRILEHLDFDLFMRNPKWIVGYSDITVFHSYLNHILGVESLHSTMPVNFPGDGKETPALNSLQSSLFGQVPSYHIQPHPLNRKGVAETELVGGNLSILYSLRGTAMDVETHGKILFIEDLGEELYHLDRMLMNLKIAGKLAELSGLIVGGMTDMKEGDPSFGKSAYEIIREAVEGYSYPVVFNFPAGHIPDNRTLPMGRFLRLEVEEEGVRLKWL